MALMRAIKPKFRISLVEPKTSGIGLDEGGQGEACNENAPRADTNTLSSAGPYRRSHTVRLVRAVESLDSNPVHWGEGRTKLGDRQMAD